MVDLAEIGLILQTISVMSAATAAVIGVRSYINSNKRAEEAKKKEQDTRNRELETRQAQLFMQVYGKWNEEGFTSHWFDLRGPTWTDYEKFKENILENPSRLNSLGVLVRFFEGLGVLVKEKLLDIRLIALTMAGDTRQFWEQYKSIVGDWRREWKHPRLMSETEYLYDELMRYMDAHPELKT